MSAMSTAAQRFFPDLANFPGGRTFLSVETVDKTRLPTPTNQQAAGAEKKHQDEQAMLVLV
jgi:hypothetical protein